MSKHSADSSKPGASSEPSVTTSFTFTTAQIVAWSKKQEEWMATPAWIKTKEGREGYKMAMRHLRYHVTMPVQEWI